MPNQCEQDCVRDYYRNNELFRLKTNIITFVLWVLAIEVIFIVAIYILFRLSQWFGITASFSTLHLLTLD